jgi:hypothetical protein
MLHFLSETNELSRLTGLLRINDPLRVNDEDRDEVLDFPGGDGNVPHEIILDYQILREMLRLIEA